MKSFAPKPWFAPQPVLIIGTYNKDGVANAMNAAWAGQWDMKEIMISMGNHVTTDNLKLGGEFTVAFATKKTMVASDFVGIVSAKNDPKKMEKTGWNIEKATMVNAPVFTDFPMTLECRIKEKYDESETGYYLVAEIVNILVDEKYLAEDCGYVRLPEGGWDWPLWKWKGEIVQEMPCMYGKFFNKKAGFISQEWWPDFCNYRRSKYPRPDDDSIEGAILSTLQSSGSLITRELRAACGFTGKGMRSKFDGYLTRQEMATYIVTEDFIYPRDKHNHEYGWGWSLLNTPEDLYGREACQCNRTPQESYQRIFEHLKEILPDASDKQIIKLIG